MRHVVLGLLSIALLQATNTTQYSVQVSASTAKLAIKVNTTSSLTIFVRYGQPVSLQDAHPISDYAFQAQPGQSSFEVAAQAGTYYIAYSSPDQGSASVSVSVSSSTSAQSPAISDGGVLNAASMVPEIASGGFVTIFGQNLAAQQLAWDSAITDGHTLPVSLGGVRVRIDGKDCFIAFVSPTQLNVLMPPDSTSGTVPVEVITPQGTARSQVLLAPSSPGLFAALSAGPDVIQLYATGLGSTSSPYPVGQILTQAYPLADISDLKVTIGGLSADVLFAGLTFPGVFQVNVRIPTDLPSGNLPVLLTLDGASTSCALVLSR